MVKHPSALSMVESWKAAWGDVASGKTLIPDALAGLTVAAVALPLNLGLAVASGLPASAGLIAGAIGGIVAALFGGANLQVTGPAAALSTMVLALATKYGAEGVAAACLIVGAVEIALGLFGAGKMIRFVPESVLAGFTTGVGLKLLDQQIPEALGFEQMGASHKFVDMANMMHRPKWLHDVSWHTAICALLVAFLVTKLKPYKRVPAAIIGMGITTALSMYLHWDVERVGTVPSALPHPSLPLVDDDKWLDLFIDTLPLALLAGVESLLSARAVDRLAPDLRPHHSNLELLGQGLANLTVGLFAGLPVSGVIVRSGVAVQSGGRTKLAPLLHGVLLVLAMVYLSKVIAFVPIAALAGLLIVIGLRLIEYSELIHLAKTQKLEAVAFVITAAGTVSGHLMAGLAVGLAISIVGRRIAGPFTQATSEKAEAKAKASALGARAIILRGEDGAARKPAHWQSSPENEKWFQNIRGAITRPKTAFVHEQASVIGHVHMGEHVHIAAGSSVRADEGTPFFIGANTNLQDGVILHALKDKHVLVSGEPWAVFVGKNVSIAHNAMVHGPCYIGDDTFIGFKAVVHDSVVGAGCFISHGAIVVGVEIPDGRLVPSGRIVDTAEAVALLPAATEQHHEFNEDVVEVNRGLAVAYHRSDRVDSSPPFGATNAITAGESGKHTTDAWGESWGTPSEASITSRMKEQF
jgi:sulfate permease, SulP family